MILCWVREGGFGEYIRVKLILIEFESDSYITLVENCKELGNFYCWLC